MATLVDSGGGAAVAGNSRLQTRVALLTILLGIYLLLMASYYLESFWSHSFIHPLKYLSAGTAFATQGAHVAIIYGLFVRRFLGSREELVYALCASLACSLVFTPLSCLTIFTALVSHRQEVVGLWEMPRIGLTLFHMYLIRRLLKELRASDTLPPPTSSRSASAPSTTASPSPSCTPPPDTPGPRPLLPPPRPAQPPPAVPPPPPPPPGTPPPPTPPTTSPPHSPPPSPPPSPPTRSSSTSTLTPPPPSPPPPPTPPPTPHLAAKTQQAAADT